jgi:hypothetical protein
MVDGVGDPILCHVTRSPGLPYNTSLTGQFADYKDPGHFVGKGWMELDFDRVLINSSTSLSIAAKVIDVKGYRIDNQGRILGKGHATRDAVLWAIPVLWPIDLLTLPGRGPRPTLKTETHLSVKLMQDVQVPYEAYSQPPRQSPQSPGYGFTPRPSDYVAPAAPAQNPQPGYVYRAPAAPPSYIPGYVPEPYPRQPLPEYRSNYYYPPSRNPYVDAYGRPLVCYGPYGPQSCYGAYGAY